MNAHKIIESLQSAQNYPPDTKMGRGWPLRAAIPTAISIASQISSMPKFEITKELLVDHGEPVEWESTLIAMGQMDLLKLPFPETYVEFPTTDPDCINFMLCWQSGPLITVYPSYFHRAQNAANIHANYYVFRWNPQANDWDTKHGFYYGPNGTIKEGDPIPESDYLTLKTGVSARMQLRNFLVLLATRNTKLRDVPAPESLNRRRAKKGKVPLFSHTVIEIDREHLEYVPQTSSGGSHASPRIHLRRGHVRNLAEGKKTFVRPCIVGVRKHGIASHDYQMR